MRFVLSSKSWAALCHLHRNGVIQHIGVSNYAIRHLQEIFDDENTICTPVFNQMELHPWYRSTELREYMSEKGVIPVGFASLGSPELAQHVLSTPLLQEIGGRHGK